MSLDRLAALSHLVALNFRIAYTGQADSTATIVTALAGELVRMKLRRLDLTKFQLCNHHYW